MQHTGMSVVVISEPGVPSGFSASLEAGQGRCFFFHNLCQTLAYDMSCVAPLCIRGLTLAMIQQAPCRAFLSHQV